MLSEETKHNAMKNALQQAVIICEWVITVNSRAALMIRVYDETGQSDRDARVRGDFVKVFARVTWHFPVEMNLHDSAFPGGHERSQVD